MKKVIGYGIAILAVLFIFTDGFGTIDGLLDVVIGLVAIVVVACLLFGKKKSPDGSKPSTETTKTQADTAKTSAPQPQMVCPDCGKKYALDQVYCEDCGALLKRS